MKTPLRNMKRFVMFVTCNVLIALSVCDPKVGLRDLLRKRFKTVEITTAAPSTTAALLQTTTEMPLKDIVKDR